MPDVAEIAGKRRAIVKRLDAARKPITGTKTCPASRHVHIIVEGLLDPKDPLHRALAEFEPEHKAESIASVLEGLWKARRWLRWQSHDPDDYTKGGEWVLDPLAVRAYLENSREAMPRPS